MLLCLSCWVKFTSPAVNITYVRFTMLYLQNFELDTKRREWNIQFNFNQLWPFTFTVQFYCNTTAISVHRKYRATLPSFLFVMTHENYSRSLFSDVLSTHKHPPTHTHARTHTHSRTHTHTPHIVISPSLFFTLFSMRLYFEQHNAVTSTEHSQVRHLEVILSVSLWWCWVISLLSFSFCLFKLSVCVRERETVSGQTSATFLSASDVCPCICVSVLSHLWASIDFN